MAKPRARELGIAIGRFPTGNWNAITDLAGVRVGHTTLNCGEGPLLVGQGPVRTGVTVIRPIDGDPGISPIFAGYAQLNGNGEMTGIAWIEESGLLTSDIAITNTHSVGVVRDAMIAAKVSNLDKQYYDFSLPVVAETSDQYLNDMYGFHVKPEHLQQALDDARSGRVEEGCVGGGTGMISFGFKAGIGTSSRVIPEEFGGWTIGVLVQSNFGQRHLFSVDGVPVGREITDTQVPVPNKRPWTPLEGDGSIIVIVGTDAPLLPHQCKRLAVRAGLGIGCMGGRGEDSSGDLMLAFSTGNQGFENTGGPEPMPVRVMPSQYMSVLFEATVECVQEAILNALCAAVTTTGRDDRIVYELPQDWLVETMRKHGRING